MARKTTTEVAPVQDSPLNQTLVEGAANQMAEHSALVMAQFGESLPYDRSRVIHEARFYMAQSAEAMLEAGKRLVILKEHESHGEFLVIVEGQLGIHERAAQRMMQASLKYLSPKLQSKATALSGLGKTKLLELLSEDDDDLAGLTEGGTVAGLKLDDIERMTSRELKTALREARENSEAKEQLIASKDAKLNELDTALRNERRQVRETPPDILAAKLREEVGGYAYRAEVAIRSDLRAGIEQILEQDSVAGTDNTVFVAGLLAQLERSIAELRLQHDIPSVVDGDPRPDWARQDQVGG